MKTTHMMIGSMMVMLLLAVAPVCAADGSDPTPTSVTNWSELGYALSVSGSGDGISVDADISISGDCELKSGVTLVIPSGKTITVIRECMFIINGDITGGGTMVNNGYTTNNGNISSDIRTINNSIWTGPGTGNYENNGTAGDLQVMTDVAANMAVICTGLSFTPTSATIFTLSAGVCTVVIPSDAIIIGTLVTVVMTETENKSNVEGKLYSVKIAGINPGTLKITLPSSSSDDRVYHVVNGVARGEMTITERTGTNVTFTTTHNSEFAVGTVSANDPDNRTNHDVTINSGAGSTIIKTGTSTQAGTFVFKVMPKDGYEIKDVRATNGDVIRNGYEYTLSNVTADTTIYVMTSEVVKDTSQDETAEYTVIGAAIGVIVMLGLAAVLVFGKKP